MDQIFSDMLPEAIRERFGNVWVEAGAIVVLSFITALLVAWLLSAWVGRLTRRTSTDLDDAILDRLRRPLFLTILFYGLNYAIRIVLLEINLTFADDFERILKTVLVFSWMTFGFSASSLLLAGLSRNPRTSHWVDSRTVPLFDNLGRIFLVALMGYALCRVWGIDATPWLTSAGILGIALGFAAKDSLGNLFSGIFILADAPYKIGDYINLDTGERGEVTQIGLRSTRILTRDDVEIVIPNSVIASAKIVNETGGPHEKERIRVPVGVSYGSDVNHVLRVLEKVAIECEGICDSPQPVARFRRFGESSLDFELMGWVDRPALRGLRIHEMNIAIFEAFRREGIEIPFPQRDLHLKSGSWSGPQD